jgi:hypothetical protein
MNLRQAEEQARQKLQSALPAPRPGGIRPTEALWALLALALSISHLLRDDASEERSRCQKVQEQHAKNLTTLLDRGGVLYVGGEPVSLCRRKS